MLLYDRLLEELNANADAEYAAFHKRLLKNDAINVIGVRVPVLRKIAKKYADDLQGLMSLPDEYYEVTFIKLTAASKLSFGEFIKIADGLVALIDNWASCDCFKADCIKKHREEFIPFIKAYLGVNREFYQRYALVTLLNYYVEAPYLGLIFDSVLNADDGFYYVHMAAAWLIAEVLIKNYAEGLAFLKKDALGVKTRDKAIQKACESYRLTDGQKEELKGLKKSLKKG